MRVHLAIAVKNLAESVTEYSKLLNTAPELVIDEQYALWRTSALNLSIRVTSEAPGSVRHVGFEQDDAKSFLTYTDRNGLVWETFNKTHQAAEIEAAWPGTGFQPH